MVTSGVSEKQLLRVLSAQAAQDLRALKHPVAYPKGEKLFAEGGQPRGVFVLSAGGARLWISDGNGNAVIARRARAGELLGLSATFSGRPYQMTVETTAPSRLGFIPREDFLRYLREHADAAFRIVELLSDHLDEVHEQTRRIGAPKS